jgi:uncharacterized protein (DUF2147 family)
MKRILTVSLMMVLALGILGSTLRAQGVLTGTWKTIADEGDDKGKANSYLDIFVKDGVYFARISKLLLEPADKVCDKCKGDLKGKPLVGLVIMSDMKKTGSIDKDMGEEYAGGDIMDPDNGKSYRCKIWIKGDTLTVRGYLAMFHRTQYWYRVK